MAKLPPTYRGIEPNFNDPSAVIREYKDSNGNLQKVEVFYGGRYGGDSEGHGHWIAENIDGLFQVTLDRNPDRIDGGAHLLESIHRTDAFSGETRTERIRKKEAVIQELSFLSPSTPGLGEKVKQLRQKFYDCGSCGKADNDSLKARFESAVDSLFKERNRELELNAIAKENLVREAERLSYSSDYKSAKDRVKELQSEWKRLPRASKEAEDSLWNRFRSAVDKVYENAKRDFEERQAKQRDAKAKKESIISRAESLIHTSDFRAASDAMKQLSEEFYNAGSAGKDNPALKDRFNSVKNRFYDAKKQAAEERRRQSEEKKAAYRRKLEEVLWRKRESVQNLERAIYNKEAQLSQLLSRPEPSYKNPNRWDIVNKRNMRESQIKEAIASMQMKKSSIIDQILEIQNKINSIH